MRSSGDKVSNMESAHADETYKYGGMPSPGKLPTPLLLLFPSTEKKLSSITIISIRINIAAKIGIAFS